MIYRLNRSSTQGSALVITMILTSILGFLMGSYLFMVKTQNLSVARARAWNSAIVVAEAGVEEAMAHLNNQGSTNNLAVNSWVNLGGGNYGKTNFLGDSYSAVTIKVSPAVTDAAPVVVSVGYVPGPISTPALTRTVQIKTRSKGGSGLPGAMIVSTTVDFKGFGIGTDSFNSTNSNYSSNGLYVASKALDRGDVTSTSADTNAVSISNGKIKGTVHTAPGGQVYVGSSGSVGDAAWVNGGNNGAQNGHLSQDANYNFPDASLPAQPFWFTPVPGNYKISGVTYKYLLNNSFPWKMSKLDGSVYVIGQNVSVWVTDDIALGSKDQIRLSGNSSVKMYVSVADAVIGGQGVINETGVASNFSYFGLPSNKSLSFAANASYVGSIYAPQADFTLGGGGKNTYDFVGQSITRSVKMNGHYNFHYDEASSFAAAAKGYTVIAWDEL